MSKPMTIDELHGILVSCAGGEEFTGVPGSVADVPLTDLGYDSLALIETATRLKVDHGVTVPDDQLTEVETLGQLLRLVNSSLTLELDG